MKFEIMEGVTSVHCVDAYYFLLADAQPFGLFSHVRLCLSSHLFYLTCPITLQSRNLLTNHSLHVSEDKHSLKRLRNC